MNARFPIALLCVGFLSIAAAEEPPDQDLALIPDETSPSQSIKVATPAERIYWEAAFSGLSQRGQQVVPEPGAYPDTWQSRVFLDVRKEWTPANALRFTLSDRLNFRDENHLSSGHENAINDLREAFLTWQPLDRVYLDGGRINLKSGVALGFNPTDFFRTRAVVEPLSADPTVLREDRLGTAMIRAQAIGHAGALTLAVAPALRNSTPVYEDAALPSVNPSFDRTNSMSRFVLKDSFDLIGNASAEALILRQGDNTLLGQSLTWVVGQKLTAYAEWAGGRRGNLIASALQYGRTTGMLPEGADALLPTDHPERFRSEIAVGASYTTERKVTFNLEFWLNQTGFTRSDWNHWFALGESETISPPMRGALWFIRRYALDQGEPVAAHSVFLRFDSADTFVRNLQVTGFVVTDLADRSALVQLGADYFLSDHWTLGALTAANIGGRRSDFGSLSPAATLLFKIARYF